MRYFVGLDWASREHAVCAVDEKGAVKARFTVEHTAAGMSDLAERLRKLAPASALAIAIERPTGLIVDTLVEGGFPVVPIHPNAVKASRPRYSAAQGKTDLGDAYLLADLLRTDGHRFRVLTPISDETKALRGLVRMRDDLVGQWVALANQLRNLLEQFWPGAAVIFADVDSPIALDFLDRYPTPQSATALGEKLPDSRVMGATPASAARCSAERKRPRTSPSSARICAAQTRPLRNSEVTTWPSGCACRAAVPGHLRRSVSAQATRVKNPVGVAHRGREGGGPPRLASRRPPSIGLPMSINRIQRRSGLASTRCVVARRC